MQPINKQDVLIRLLKDGHISSEEFKALWESMPKPIIREITCGTVGSKIGSKELEKGLKERVFADTGIGLRNTTLTSDEVSKISKDYYDAFNEMKAIKDSLNKDQETTPPPQGMHPKTWAFLNEQHGN